MIALHLAPDPRLLLDAPEPACPNGEALIGLRLAGVCDTDLQLARGYMGFEGTPGHEFVGEVIECADREWIGKRVVGDINAGCGECEECRERDGHHCAVRSVLGILGRQGCFAERFSLPARNLVELPTHLPDDLAVFAEPLAAGLHVLDEVRSRECERIAVLGDGKLGLLTALALATECDAVTLIGHHEHKLAIAREAGLSTKLESDLASFDAQAFDLVVEATGHPGGLARAFELTRPRGTVVLKTTVADPAGLDLSPIVIHELQLVGSRCGDLARAIEVLASGAVDPRPLIQARFPLNRAPEALAEAGRRGVLKVLLSPT